MERTPDPQDPQDPTSPTEMSSGSAAGDDEGRERPDTGEPPEKVDAGTGPAPADARAHDPGDEEPRGWADDLIAEAAAPRAGGPAVDPPEDRRWRRSRSERLIAGVAATLARRSGLPVWLVRLAFVVGAVAGGFGVVAYLGTWALLPEEGSDRSLTDDWRLKFAAAESPFEKLGLILIAAAVVLAVGASGAVAAPLTGATLLVFIGLALMRPLEN